MKAAAEKPDVRPARATPMPKARAYTAYFDTGGSESHQGVLVTAGAVSTTHKWARLDRKWLSVLETHGVSTLHMMELAHWKGEYSKWNRDETIRRAFLEDLSDVIAREVNKVVCVRLWTFGWSSQLRPA
jgi:hypothetical protein